MYTVVLHCYKENSMWEDTTASQEEIHQEEKLLGRTRQQFHNLQISQVKEFTTISQEVEK